MKVILLEDVKSLGKKGELVNVNDGELKIGEFYNVRITDATEFDLMGVVEE